MSFVRFSPGAGIIDAMSIAHHPNGEPGYYGDETGRKRWWDGSRWSSEVREESLIPEGIKRERLDQQIASFERAGYRLETRSGLQAVVAKDREPRPVHDLVLTIVTLGIYRLPLRAARRRPYHRVVITVDQGGAVRFA